MYLRIQPNITLNDKQIHCCFIQGKVWRGEKMSRTQDRPRVCRQIHPCSPSTGQGGCAAGNGGHEETAAQALIAALRRILPQERDVSHPGNVIFNCLGS